MQVRAALVDAGSLQREPRWWRPRHRCRRARARRDVEGRSGNRGRVVRALSLNEQVRGVLARLVVRELDVRVGDRRAGRDGQAGESEPDCRRCPMIGAELDVASGTGDRPALQLVGVVAAHLDRLVKRADDDRAVVDGDRDGCRRRCVAGRVLRDCGHAVAAVGCRRRVPVDGPAVSAALVGADVSAVDAELHGGERVVVRRGRPQSRPGAHCGPVGGRGDCDGRRHVVDGDVGDRRRRLSPRIRRRCREGVPAVIRRRGVPRGRPAVAPVGIGRQGRSIDRETDAGDTSNTGN